MQEERTGSGYHRRGVLRRGGAAVAAGSLLAAGVGTGAGETAVQEEPTGSLTIEDQRSDGTAVVLASVSTSVEAQLIVVSERENEQGENTLYGRRNLSAGTDTTDLTVQLDEQSIAETRVVRVILFGPADAEEPEPLAMDTAVIAVGEDPDRFGVRRVEADPESGFEYPYFLYRPVSVERDEVALLVQGNNTGTATDDFSEHREAARQDAERGKARRIADELGVPLLIPVFPRPRSEPVDGTHYTHQLDQDTLEIEGGPLERIDLQLLAMVDHARTTELAEADFTVREQVMLNGFSASGNFADRFTMLHPERVLSVTAGGLNGMAVLPLEEAKGRTLNYHVGIADIESITGEPVDLDALDRVNQFLYMGSRDENDTIPFDDAWTSDELRETALTVYGEDMIADRFPFCQEAYERAGVSARFEIIEGVGHSPVDTERLVEFHRLSMNGEEPTGFGEDLQAAARAAGEPSAAFEVGSDPVAGEPVRFDASGSRGGEESVVAYVWSFGDGETAAGESVTHTFDSGGSYTVELRIVDGTGAESSVSREVTVAAAPTPEPTPSPEPTATPTPEPTATPAPGDGTPEPTSEPTSTPDRTPTGGTATPSPTTAAAGDTAGDGDTTATAADGPGFGALAALVGLGGVAELRRRLDDREDAG